jgi:hypothetical protein
MPSKALRLKPYFGQKLKATRIFFERTLSTVTPRLFLRWGLAAASLIIILVLAPDTVRQYFTTSRYLNENVIFTDSPYNELIAGSIQSKLTLSTNLFQMELLITAGLVGLLIAKDKETGFVLAQLPEKIMFICASLLLLLSYIFHYLYFTEVSYIYTVAGKFPGYDKANPSMPDVLDPSINYLYSHQVIYLVWGSILAAFTFFSAHIIRGGLKR